MRPIVEALVTDVRQALRRLTRSPGLSAIVILALTPPIVANTTIFSLLKVTVLQKLAVPDPDALVAIEASDVRTNAYSGIYLPTYQRLKEQPGVLASIGAFTSSLARIESGAVAISTGIEGVTPDYFTVLAVQPAFGRVIGPGDDPLAAVGVLSERLSLRLFGTADVAGRRLLVDGRPIEIIGVMASGFTGIRMDGGDDLFVPIAYLRFTQSGDAKSVPRAQQIIGRLVRGASVEAARAEVLGRWPAIQTAVSAELPAALRPNVENQQLKVSSFARGFSSTRNVFGRSLTLVMALAVAMLAIGCVNLSALMLARALTRQHEFAVRRALGVSRLRLFHQSAIDGVLLSIVAVLIAFPLARAASSVLVSMVSVAKAVPIGDVAPDWTVMALAAAVSIVVGVVISLLPARRAISLDMDEVLRGRGTAHRVRGAARTIVIVQVALSVILVVGAGLFAATLSNLYANHLQRRDHQVVWTRLARSPLERGNPLEQPYFEDLSARLAAMPGADAAAYSVFYPGYLSFFDSIPRDKISVPGGAEAAAVSDSVSPGFFDLYSIALLRGRDFTWFDRSASPAVAIVNETLARQLSPSSDVVGRRVRVTSGPSNTEVQIVGIVADANVTHIRDGRTAGLYRPLMQDMLRAQNPLAHVRVRGDLAAAQRGYLDAVNERGQHSVLALFTFDDWLDNAVVEQRLLASMSGFAAVLAVSLSALGLFALLAYSVSSRTREIGVRISIGAGSGEVARMIMREGLLAVMPGLVMGIALALGVAWALRSQFFGVSAADPRVIAVAAFVILVTATFASWLPARRAARVQPIDALRQD